MGFENDNIIGIVGGMGPQAGIALFNSIMACTRATADQQHLSTILMSFPGQIADRTDFLEGELCINPAFNIAEVIMKLEHAGANIIGIACNTSHSPPIYDVILDELNKRNSQVKVLHMPIETCRLISEKYPQFRRIGIMVTNGTYKSELYAKLLHQFRYEPIVPDFEFQNTVIHSMIYDREFGLKANAGVVTPKVRTLMGKALRYFGERRADAIILGCTDLSVMLSEKQLKGIQIIDSTESLARALVNKAGNCERIEYNGESILTATSKE